MTVARADLDRDLAAEAATVAGLVAGLDEDGWRRPTPAPGWSIADQISHLAYFDEQAVLSATEPGRFREQREAERGDIDGFTARVAEAHRAIPGRELLAWFDRARRELIEATTGLPLSARVPWYGPDMSLASALTARIMETWAHGLDIADAVGVERPPGPGLRSIAELAVRALRNGFVSHGLPAPEAPVRVELTAPSGELWCWGPDDAGDVVRGPALDFCLLSVQRRHRAGLDLVATGSVADQWLDVAQAFAGPPGAGRQPGGPAGTRPAGTRPASARPVDARSEPSR